MRISKIFFLRICFSILLICVSLPADSGSGMIDFPPYPADFPYSAPRNNNCFLKLTKAVEAEQIKCQKIASEQRCRSFSDCRWRPGASKCEGLARSQCYEILRGPCNEIFEGSQEAIKGEANRRYLCDPTLKGPTLRYLDN